MVHLDGPASAVSSQDSGHTERYVSAEEHPPRDSALESGDDDDAKQAGATGAVPLGSEGLVANDGLAAVE